MARRLVSAALLLAGCAATVPEVEHRAVLAKEKERYELTIKRLEEDRARGEADCTRAAEEKDRALAVAGERLGRLEESLADKQRLLDQAIARLHGEASAPTKVSYADLAPRLRAALKGKGELTTDADGLRVAIAADAVFPKSSVRLAPDAEAFLHAVGEPLAKATTSRIELAVHSDSVHPPPGASIGDTWELTQHQALAVARALASAGVDPSRLTVTAGGEHHPIASNDTEEGRARNRRIEITVSPIVR